MKSFVMVFRISVFVVLFFLPFGSFSYLFAEKNSAPSCLSFGVFQDTAESCLSEKGVLQLFPHSFSVTPLLEMNTKWRSHQEISPEIYFEEGYVPVVSSVWNFQDLRMEIKAFTCGEPEESMTFVRYQLQNKMPHSLEGKIYFLLEPHPKAFIHSLEFSEAAQSIRINEKQKIILSALPEELGFLKQGKGKLLKKIKQHEMLQLQSVKDPKGKASGVWSYAFKLEGGQKTAFGMAVALHPSDENREVPHYRQSLLEARTFWRKKLNVFELQIQEASLTDLLRAQLIALFVARDNPGFYPEEYKNREPRTQDTLEAIQTYLAYGFFQEAREDLEMVSLRIDPAGEVTVRMDQEGKEIAEKEYHLQGRFVSAILEYYQFTQDKTWLAAKWPVVKRTLDYLKHLRAERLTEWYATQRPELKRYYGILPPSGNGERKDPTLLHRYEDDFWALKAWKDAQTMAEILDKPREAKKMKEEERALRRGVLDSIEQVESSDQVRFLPAVAEKSTLEPWIGALAVWPSEEASYLPSERVDYHLKTVVNLFEKSQESEKEKALEWSDFPVIRALLRRGQKDSALQMFRFQLKNLKKYDFKKAADFSQMFRDFFVYETGEKIVLGAGIVPEWVGPKKGLRVRLPTHFGEVIYDVTPSGEGYRVKVSGNAKPPEGFIFHSPHGFAQQIFPTSPFDFEIQ